MNTTKGINEIVLEFIENSDISRASAQTYKRTLAVFVNWMVQNGNVKSPSKADLIRFKNHLLESKKEILTLDSYLKVVMLFFKFCTIQGYIDDNIALGISRPKRYLGHKKGYLTNEQVDILLKSINPVTLIEYRNFAIINLMVRSALRCVEISRLNVGDIVTTLSGSCLRIQRKGHIRKDAVIGITNKSLQPIENYLALRGVFSLEDPLFGICGYHHKSNRLSSLEIGRIVTTQLIRCGLKSKTISAHSLRHTAASNAIKAGVPIWDVSKALGHSSVNTTQIYVSAIEAERLQVNPAIMALDNVY